MGPVASCSNPTVIAGRWGVGSMSTPAHASRLGLPTRPGGKGWSLRAGTWVAALPPGPEEVPASAQGFPPQTDPWTNEWALGTGVGFPPTHLFLGGSRHLGGCRGGVVGGDDGNPTEPSGRGGGARNPLTMKSPPTERPRQRSQKHRSPKTQRQEDQAAVCVSSWRASFHFVCPE